MFTQVGFPDTDPFLNITWQLARTHVVVAVIIQHLSIKSAQQAVGRLSLSWVHIGKLLNEFFIKITRYSECRSSWPESSRPGSTRPRNISAWSYFAYFFHKECQYSVCVYVVIISKYATKIVGMQNRQVACVPGTQDQKQSTFSKFKPGPELNSIES